MSDSITNTVNQSLIDVIADLMANGWDYGTHPQEKARIVLEAIQAHRTPDSSTLQSEAPDFTIAEVKLNNRALIEKLQALGASNHGVLPVSEAITLVKDFMGGALYTVAPPASNHVVLQPGEAIGIAREHLSGGGSGGGKL